MRANANLTQTDPDADAHSLPPDLTEPILRASTSLTSLSKVISCGDVVEEAADSDGE